MSREKDFQAAIKDIKKACKKHGIFLIGTCGSEGIYGEITIGSVDSPDDCGWKEPLSRVNNKLYEEYGGTCVDGIG